MGDAAPFAARMINALGLADPDVDTSVGTVPRKIIDMLAEQLAEIDSTQDLLAYRFDIDSKHGADLDDFVAMFGFSRFPARRARGTVTIFRPAPAPQHIYIPAGTQVSTSSVRNPVVFSTLGGSYMAKGTTSVDVPVVAVLGGAAGNVAANTIDVLVNGIESLSSATVNAAATHGGADQESDQALVMRFKKTVFRSIAGTEDMYLGTALEADPTAAASGTVPTQAKVLGVSARWNEQVQIEQDGTAESMIPTDNVKYIFDDSFVLGPDIASGQILARDVHYTVDTSVMPPKITSISLEEGAIYDLEFEYTSSASRNDPAVGISNRIDVWVNGEDIREAGEAFTYTNSRAFTSATGDVMSAQNYVRLNLPDQHPDVGNTFSQLTWGPIYSVPDVIVAAGTEYREGVDFHIVHEDTAFGWGPTSRFGIEWITSTPPSPGTQIGLTYLYNRIPRDVEARIRRWRLVGTDARAHAAKPARLVLHMAVMYVPGVNTSLVNQGIFRALSDHMEVRGFASKIQVSDLLHAAAGVNGVDNVRMLNSGDDPSNYGIQEVTATGIEVKKWAVSGRAVDVLLKDDQVPILHDVRIDPRAQNTIYDLG